MKSFVPTIGRWYQEETTQQLFEIVAIEAEDASIQVQYLDGEIASFELEAWAEMALSLAAAPEDWRSAFELDQDDQLDPDAAQHPLQWSSPVNSIEPDTVLGVEDP